MDKRILDLCVKLASHHLTDDDEMGVVAKTVLEYIAKHEKTERHRWADVDMKLRTAENMLMIINMGNNYNIEILDKKVNKLIECLQLLNSGR